ncbi:MAG: hypothetical protein JSW64_14830 [Candidatus Zixiibacteriota bacterium]|nr:MAG: hypothetical protein JSW64_14830 [candidate division Zixibacteria bacterium]
MKKSLSVLIIIAALVIFPAASFAQLAGYGNGYLIFNTPGGGARAAGMGGAFIAMAEGEMAFSWNPAAMIYTDKTKFGIDFISRQDKINDFWLSWRYWDLGNPHIESYEADLAHTSLSYGGFSAPFSLDSDSDARFVMLPLLPLSIIPMTLSPSEDMQLTVGGGYRHIFNMTAEFELPGFDNSKNTFDQNRGLDAISLGIAAKIREGIGFGWTMNAYVRGTEFNQISGESAIISEFINDNRADTIVAEWYKLKSTFSGFNMDIGLSANYSMVKAGVVVHTPYKIYQRAMRTYQVVVPPEPVGLIDRISYTYDMPLSASFGLALSPVERLSLAFDYVYRPLSEVTIKTDWEQIDLSFMDTTRSAEWEDVNQYRVGIEYIFDARFADIPIRLGMRNEPLAVRELAVLTVDVLDSTGFFDDFVDFDVERGDKIATDIIAFGTGLAFDNIWFDIGYQFGSYSYDATVRYYYTDISEDPNAPTETRYDDTQEIKVDYSKLFFSVGMYF